MNLAPYTLGSCSWAGLIKHGIEFNEIFHTTQYSCHRKCEKQICNQMHAIVVYQQFIIKLLKYKHVSLVILSSLFKESAMINGLKSIKSQTDRLELLSPIP